MEYHSGGSLPLLGRPRYCSGTSANGGANGGYLCESGHCCGETGCCTYYYELWWFWLLWTVLIVFSCCCAYRHRRAKLRVQQQRQRDIGLLAYHGAPAFTSSMLDLSFLASLKLPSYEEVAAQPSTPPPPYSSVFTAPRYPQPPPTTDPHLLTQHGALLHRQLSDGPSSLSSDNSSSCSCDSCCPSSPCSSSLSAPVTYETDTSHASTPSEATPLALEDTVRTVSAAISRLDVSNAEEPDSSEPSAHQTVTVEVVTIATPPPPPAAVTDAPLSGSSDGGCSSNLDPGSGSDSGARLAAAPGSQSPDGSGSSRTLEAEPNPEGRTLLLDLCAPPTSDPSPVLEPIPSYPEGRPNLTTDPSGPEPVLWTTCPDPTPLALTPPTSDPNPELCPKSGPPDGSLDLLVPSITIDPESAPLAPPQVVTPPCQHALLLDPLTALTGAASGPAPSQSPPKQTLFSPCVDVFEPSPSSWDEDCEDEDDVGADESQYRHRRLTGDSGIEVCRCRVEDEEEEEEEEEGAREDEDKKGGNDLHDRLDCPVRAQMSNDGLRLCSAATSPTNDGSGEVVVVMETV